MEFDDSQEKYLKHYIQRQEMLLLEYIRKTIDLELKAISLNSSLIEYKSKYEESQKQVEVQNELMQQAANGVESLTIEKKKYEKTVEELKTSLSDCRNERVAIANELKEAKQKIDNFDNEIKIANNRADEIREEYNRQTKELSELFKENQVLKSKLPINKTKAKKETAILPPDEF
jgi:chromosome segregation ATPase